MSYDISIVNKKGEVIVLKKPHQFKGGTYAIDGTTEAWLNITYNYGPIFRRVFNNPDGIRTLYGMQLGVSMPLLASSINLLKGAPDPDYWAATDGNVRVALLSLLELACHVLQEGHHDAIWSGD